MIELQDYKNRQTNTQKGIVLLHEENQSLLQVKDFIWEYGVSFKYKNKTKLVFFIKHNFFTYQNSLDCYTKKIYN